jgi:hypothetical protein
MGLPDWLTGPRAVVREAIEAVPAVKWALGVAGVVAAFAIAANFIVSLPSGTLAATVYSAIGMFFLMVVLTIFAKLSAAAPTVFKAPIQVLTWGSIVFLFAASFLFISAAFFRWPQRLCEVWNTCTSDSRSGAPGVSGQPSPDPEPDVVSRREIAIEDPVLTQARRPLPSDVSGESLVAQLRARRSLVLDNATLRIGTDDPADTPVTLAFHTLELRNGARVVTRGRHAEISVLRLIVESGVLAAWPEGSNRKPASSPSGQRGPDGRWAGVVTLRVVEEFRGRLRVDLRGQDGGDGGPGAPGSRGGPGNRGADAVQGVFDCRSGGQDGGGGQQGTSGQAGGDAGDGGGGGELRLLGVLTTADARSRLDTDLSGGHPGGLGHGGPGGPGGPGGQGGSGAGLCGGGRPGPEGPAGPRGPDGSPGKSGPDGRVMVTP